MAITKESPEVVVFQGSLNRLLHQILMSQTMEAANDKTIQLADVLHMSQEMLADKKSVYIAESAVGKAFETAQPDETPEQTLQRALETALDTVKTVDCKAFGVEISVDGNEIMLDGKAFGKDYSLLDAMKENRTKQKAGREMDMG